MGNFSRRVDRASKKKSQRTTTNPTPPTIAIEIYRGTARVEELRLIDEMDGYVVSEVARDGYRTHAENEADFIAAWHYGLEHSNKALTEAYTALGGVDQYCFAHSRGGTEFAKKLGGRGAIS